MRSAGDWAARLATGEPIAERVAVVVAHPDDETLWTGSLLPRLQDCLLIHLTDGAPEDMDDARRLGFATRQAYAAAREREIERALVVLGAAPKRLCYGVTDKTAALMLADLANRLARDIRHADAVLTHPYEGGHPDHDAAAWAVAAACRALGPGAPAHLEFACYHEVEGERLFGRFWPGPPEHGRDLSVAERARVAQALAAHESQAGVIAGWVPVRERWRAAPAYDFAAPPPPGRALYDRFGWDMTSGRFSALARAAEREPVSC